MPRIMAVDYGLKRTGLAVTDPSGIIARGLGTVNTTEIFGFLDDYFSRETVECVVVGDPKGLDGKDTDASPHVRSFVKKLKKRFTGIRVEQVDERFSSVMAAKSLVESGVKKSRRRDKALVDEVSATLILQSWLSKPGYLESI